MPVIALAEDAVQQAGRAEQPDVAAMQRRDRTPCGYVFAWHQKRQCLFPCTRQRQQVFQQVIRQPAITQSCLSGWRHEIWFARPRRQLRQSLKAAIRADTLKLPSRLLDGHAAHIAANSQNSNLSEANRFFVSHAKDIQPGEV